jgi:hypothetical protein
VIAAAADDGTLLMAYRPPTHSGGFAVDMTAMRGLTLARWWDPTTGVFSDGGVSLDNAGVRWFEPPAANAAGAGDWVLILTSN